MFAEVALSISTFQSFTYKIPSDLIHIAQVGCRVKVPLGNRTAYGVITAISDASVFKGEFKSIFEIIDDVPILTKELWRLIHWISYYYVTPFGKVFNTVLPINISKNYSPRKYWYAKYLQVDDRTLISALKKNTPLQSNVYLKIKQISPISIKVSSLKSICSNPLSICRSLERKKLISLFREENQISTEKLSFEPIEKIINFNEDQNKVIKTINNSLYKKQFNSHLLHGVTGSGKTEIFIEAIKTVVEKNKTAILLLPEISLTPQIAGRFKSVFPGKIVIWHSQLTKSQRNSAWKKIYNGTYNIVIGARSAIFTPLKNIGLIIIDEEHDSSYKQESPSPRYHARDVAVVRAKFEKANILLSSATPSLESYYNSQNNKYKYLNLPKRYGKASYPKVQIVDLLEENQESGKMSTVISGLLLDKIEKKLEIGEQILLIQNRRGFSTSVRCLDCGETIMCSACKAPLTFHIHENRLKCHTCGYVEKKSNENCNSCMGQNLIYIGTGTQKVENILNQTFPGASIARVDYDIINKGTSMVDLLQSFSDNKIDILIGTQMIAKGLDFPNVTLVGIINADLGLHMPDFRSSERTFQLIYQAAGRSGRGEKKGEVIIQTYDIKNPVIQAASKLDLNKYYKIMLDDRSGLKYPPFSWIAKIEFIGSNSKSVFSLSTKIKNNLLNRYKGLVVLGPAACFKEKIKNNFRFQIILKSIKKYDSSGDRLHSFINDNFIQNKNLNIGSNKIHIHIDPLSMI
tara:strand:- start:2479 stop:4716 length:2238 start_codon:yes stop_codon:yes gene_type:complete